MSALQFILKLGDQVSGPARKMAKDLGQIKGHLGKTDAAARLFERTTRYAMHRSADAMSRAEARAKSLSGAIHKTASAARGLASSLVSLPSLVTAGALGLGAKSVIDAANFRENTLIAFSTMLKSRSEGERLLQEAVKFASVTPFETGDVIDAYQKLVAFQFKPVELPVVMKAVGDVAALKGMDKGVIDRLVLVFGQIRAKGKLQLEELMQLVEAGGPGMATIFDIIGKKLGKKTREEVQKLVSAGQVSSDLGIVAVLEGIRDTLSGGQLGSNMAQMSQTAKGLASTLASRPLEIFMPVADTVGMADLKLFLSHLVELTDSASSSGKALRQALVDLASSTLSAVFGPLAKATSPRNLNIDAIVAGIRRIEAAIRTGLPRAMVFIRDFAAGFAEGLGILKGAWQAVSPLVQWVGGLVARLFGAKGASQSIGSLAGMFTVLLGAVALIQGPISVVVSIISGLAPIVKRVVGFLPGLLRLVWGCISAFGGLVGTLIRLGAAWLVGLGPIGWAIAAVLGIGAALVAAYRYFPWFRDGVNAAWAAIQQAGLRMVAWFQGLPAQMASIGTAIINGIKNGIMAGWDGLKSAVSGVASGAVGLAKKALGIASPSRVFAAVGRQIPAGLAAGIVAGSPLVGTAMGTSLPLPAGGGGAARAATLGSVVFNINVSGSGDARQVAAAVEQVARESILVELERLAKEVGG